MTRPAAIERNNAAFNRRQRMWREINSGELPPLSVRIFAWALTYTICMGSLFSLLWIVTATPHWLSLACGR